MKHPRNVPGYAKFEQLVDEIVTDDYHKIFIEELADDLKRQADNDFSKGRSSLAGRLYNTSEKLYEATRMMDRGRNPGNVGELAVNVGMMQYDCTAKVIKNLSDKLAREGLLVLEGNRQKGENLVDAAEKLNSAYDEMISAWKICRIYMDD